MRISYRLVIAAVLLLQIVLAGCAAVANNGQGTPETPPGENAENASPAPTEGTESDAPETDGPELAVDEEADKKAVAAVVEQFGRQLKLVSLLAPEDTVKQAIEEHYETWITPGLLNAWLSDPSKAPGSLTSSPRPDRIEIEEIAAVSDGSYEVTGYIIETAGGQDDIAAKQPITLRVVKLDDRWAIDDLTLGEYETSGVAYTNDDFGFTLSLPDSWEGYTIVTDQWEGQSMKEDNAGETVESGPIIIVRHPEWTEETPRQDIPIMVLTLEQWEAMEAGDFHIGAGPAGPNELDRNDKYVMALPARYNFAFPEGYEEVDEIINDDPLQAFPLKK